MDLAGSSQNQITETSRAIISIILGWGVQSNQSLRINILPFSQQKTHKSLNLL